MTTAGGTPPLALTSADLAALAGGGDGQQRSLEKIYAGQLTKHKLLISAVVRFGGRAVPAAAATLREHYDLLAAAERTAPDAVAAVLRYPHVGAWAAQAMRQLSRDPGSAAAGLGYLGAIAASAAIRAGHACSVSLRLVDGALVLPAFGRAVLPGTRATVTVCGPAEATIAAGGRVITIPPGPGADVPGWQPARVLAMGDRPLLLDDLDPHRSYEPYPLPGRLGDRDVAHWQRALDEAWRLLARYHPGYAAALRSGLRSLVPIGQRADDRNVSATSGDAFGAVAASMPSDGASLAVALMHEFQHAKLCAVNDLEPLASRQAGPLFYAPWRPDPRPAGALLHGIFAHMAVADFWRVHRQVTAGEESLLAHVEFARWLRQTHYAAGLLAGHDALTAAGRQLLARVTARLTAWLGEPVPSAARKLAAETAADHLSCWRLRNLEPEPGGVERLARDWRAGRPGHGVVRTRMRAEPLTAGRNIRPDLLYLRLRDPARFERDDAARAGAPDAAYARGDHAAAARGYLAQLRADPGRLHAWTGLGIVTGAHGTLTRCPEVAYALQDRLARDGAPRADPLRLARWLSRVSTVDLEVQV
jgi:HEXXH motif-containing protein